HHGQQRREGEDDEHGGRRPGERGVGGAGRLVAHPPSGPNRAANPTASSPPEVRPSATHPGDPVRRPATAAAAHAAPSPPAPTSAQSYTRSPNHQASDRAPNTSTPAAVTRAGASPGSRRARPPAAAARTSAAPTR